MSLCQSKLYPKLNEKFEADLKILSSNLSHFNTRNCFVNPSAKEINYRTSAKLVVRQDPKTKSTHLGLYAPNSHELVSMRDCPIHHLSIKRLIPALEEEIDKTELRCWNEKNNTGDLKFIIIRVSRLTEELMLNFVVTNKECRLQLKQIIRNLKTRFKIHACYFNLNASLGNNVLGSHSYPLLGIIHKLRDSIAGVQAKFQSMSFMQNNPWVAENIYQRVEQILGTPCPGEKLWDLYCGSGVLSILMAKTGYKVCVEENPHAINDANENIKRNELDPKK